MRDDTIADLHEQVRELRSFVRTLANQTEALVQALQHGVSGLSWARSLRDELAEIKRLLHRRHEDHHKYRTERQDRVVQHAQRILNEATDMSGDARPYPEME